MPHCRGIQVLSALYDGFLEGTHHVQSKLTLLIPLLWVSGRTSVQEVSLLLVTWDCLGLVQFTRSWIVRMICSDNGSMMRKKVAKFLNLASNASRLLRFLIARVIHKFSNLTRSTLPDQLPPCYRNMSQATIFSCAWRARS